MGNNAIKDTGRSIACKQLDLVYQRYSFSFVSSLLISSTLVAMLWPLVAHSVLLAWLLSLWSVMVARNYHARRYLRLMPDVDLGKWRSGLVAGAAAAGACWGLSVFFLSVSPLDPAALPLIFVIAGVSAFASGTMAAERLAVVAFLLTALLPPALWLALSGDRLHVYMALITLAHTGLMLLFSREIHRLIRNSLSTPEQNWQISAAIKQVRALEHAAARQESERCYSERLANFEDNIFFLDFEEQGGFTVASINPAEERSFGLIDDEVRGLRKSETQFRTLAENALDPIYRYDRDCRRIYVNPAVTRISGQPLAGLLGKRPTEARLVPSEESVKVQQSIQRVLDTGMPDEIEVLFVAPDGRELYFQNIHVPEFGEDGAVESVLSIGRDTTSRRRMEEVLLQSESEYRMLSENSPDNIVRYDRECRIRYLNKNAAAALGLSTAYMLRKASTEVFSDGLFDELELVLKGVIESGQPAEHYVALPDLGEGERYQHLRMMPEKNERGEVTGVLSIGRDITEQKRIDDVLKEKEQRLSSFISSAPGFFFTLFRRQDGSMSMPFSSVGITSIFDLQPEDVAGSVESIISRYHPDDVERVLQKVGASGQNLMPCHVEFRVLNHQKGERWVEARSMPHRDEAGNTCWHGFMQDITERKNVQQRMEFLERAIDVSADAIFLIDEQLRFNYVNETACRSLGYSREELLAMGPCDIDPDMPREQIMELMKSSPVGPSTNIETRHRAKDGRSYPVELSGVFFEDGGAKFGLSVVHDISERKRMEETLTISEREFRSLAENLPDNIARWDVEGRYLYINPVHERTLGVSASEVIGKPLPDTHEHVKAAIAQAVATGLVVELVRQSVPVDGEIQIHEVSLVPERDATGRIVSVLGLGRNMTEFYRMQDGLAASEREFRTLAENLPDPIFRYGPDGRRIYVNQAVVNISGKSAESLLGQTPTDARVVASADADRILAGILRVVETRQPFELEVTHVKPDGTKLFFINRHVPEFDLNGNVVSVLAIASDITERKRYEQSLLERAELEQRQLQFFDVAPGFFYTSVRQTSGHNAMPFASSGIRQLFGLEPEDVAQNSEALLALIHPDDCEQRLCNIEESRRNMTRLHYECRFNHPQNGLRWMEVDSRPQHLPDGGIRWDGFMHDITERKRTEDVLTFIAQGEWLSSGEEFLHVLVRYLGKILGVDYVVIDTLSADHAYVETMALYAKGAILPNMQYALQGTPCKEVMAGKSCCYADDVRGLFPDSSVLAKMQADSYVGVPLLNVEGRVIGLIAALDSLPMADANAVKSMLQLVASSAAAELVRSQMEGVLHDSHESLNEAQRISHVGSWELDLASGALLWSDEIYRIFEIDPAQFSASYEAFLNAIHPDDREAVSQAYRESLENRAPYEIEHRLSMADGRIKYVHECCETLYAEDGRPLRSTGTVQDISERKRAEEALRASEEKIRSLFELSPLGIALTDMQGRYVEFNEAFRAICGYPADELITLDYWTLTPREYESREGEQLESLSRTGRYGPYEKEYRQKDGTLVPIQLNGMSVTGRDGQQYIWSIVEDITERKRAAFELQQNLKWISKLNVHLEQNARDLEDQAVEIEASQEQIKQTEAWYRSILHSAPDGMLVVDERGVIMQVNARLDAMFGYSSGELQGCYIEVLLPHAVRPSHVGMRTDFVAGNNRYREAMVATTLFGCRKDGTEFPVDVSLSQLPEIDGMRRAICASVRDITERQVMEAAREEALAQAQRLAQLRSTFMAQMSHELRTPLNGILGYTQNLLHGDALGEKQLAGLNVIQQSGEHLLSLINGILDHAAIEADKLELILGDIQLDPFLIAIVGIIRIRAEQKNISFSCDAGEDLPAIVRGDVQRLRQVLINLLANAVKFTDSGYVTLRVNYSAPSRIRFAVQDSGVGIGIDQLENIFLPFEQAGETSRRAGGSGLGLSISRELVRLMGGDIVVESRLGAGSTFSFEIEMEAAQSCSARVNTASLSEQAVSKQATPLSFAPPQHELDILHGLALRGSMRDVMRHADQLLEYDARYLDFVEQMRQLTRSFQTKALLRLIEQYRKGTKQ